MIIHCYHASKNISVIENLTPVKPWLLDWMPEFYPSELSYLADAYLRVAVKSPRLFSALAPQVLDNIDELQPLTLSTLARVFSLV